MHTRFKLSCFLPLLVVCGLSVVCSKNQADSAEPLLPPVLLQMARDPAIHTELGLSTDQRTALLEATDAVDPVLWPSRILPADQQLKITDQLTSQLWRQTIQILDAEQRERMLQLQRQAMGTRMLLRPEVADELKLGLDEREKIRNIALETDQAAQKLQKKLLEGGQATEINQQLAEIKDKERKGIVGLLSNAQKQQIGKLAGAPFDFSKVTRTHPRAPELIAQPDQWLHGSPLKMSDLRGKVVVLHFYAFQCINCRRNLPHYNGWHEDFSSDDVVIIGIQTPETSAEMDPKKVAAAIDAENISYPVLFDKDSKNWKAWGNTMWPTVYLIDRDGFIRTWWQGELNWQGAKGEEQYRGLIRQLVSEKPASYFSN